MELGSPYLGTYQVYVWNLSKLVLQTTRDNKRRPYYIPGNIISGSVTALSTTARHGALSRPSHSASCHVCGYLQV